MIPPAAIMSLLSASALALPKAGDRLPGGFRPVDQARQARNLEFLSGRNGLVLVCSRSAGWCPICEARMVALKDATARLAAKGEGLAVITWDATPVLAQFHARQQLPYPLLSDAGSRQTREAEWASKGLWRAVRCSWRLCRRGWTPAGWRWPWRQGRHLVARRPKAPPRRPSPLGTAVSTSEPDLPRAAIAPAAPDAPLRRNDDGYPCLSEAQERAVAAQGAPPGERVDCLRAVEAEGRELGAADDILPRNEPQPADLRRNAAVHRIVAIVPQ